jgi:hypothetical protein
VLKIYNNVLKLSLTLVPTVVPPAEDTFDITKFFKYDIALLVVVNCVPIDAI